MNAMARLGIIGLSVGLSTLAQAQPVAERPKFDVGDKWNFSDVAADGKKGDLVARNRRDSGAGPTASALG